MRLQQHAVLPQLIDMAILCNKSIADSACISPCLYSQAEASLEGCQGCQLTPLEFWRLAQLNPNFSLSVGQKI